MEEGIGGFLIGLIVLIVVALLTFGGWKYYEYSVNKQNDIMQTGHPMQQGDIAEDRDLAHDWIVTTDPGQKRYIANEFCSTFKDITVVPADLQSDKAQICVGQ